VASSRESCKKSLLIILLCRLSTTLITFAEVAYGAVSMCGMQYSVVVPQLPACDRGLLKAPRGPSRIAQIVPTSSRGNLNVARVDVSSAAETEKLAAVWKTIAELTEN
jgi:hypothetical protein